MCVCVYVCEKKRKREPLNNLLLLNWFSLTQNAPGDQSVLPGESNDKDRASSAQLVGDADGWGIPVGLVSYYMPTPHTLTNKYNTTSLL